MSPELTRTSVRLLEAILEKLQLDPVAVPNLSAFVLVQTHQFVAHNGRAVSVRQLGTSLNSKTAYCPISIVLTYGDRDSLRRYARQTSNQSLGALIQTALTRHYFPHLL